MLPSFQCTEAEAQLQAAEKRLADILANETDSLQKGEHFIEFHTNLIVVNMQGFLTQHNTLKILVCVK